MSRLLTLAAAGHQAAALAAALKNPPKGAPPVIALTGSGGVGKSSLLVRWRRTLRSEANLLACWLAIPKVR